MNSFYKKNTVKFKGKNRNTTQQKAKTLAWSQIRNVDAFKSQFAQQLIKEENR